MLAAETGLPPRDFGAAPIVPAASSEPAGDTAGEAGGRPAFYRALAQDFAEAARGDAPR